MRQHKLLISPTLATILATITTRSTTTAFISSSSSLSYYHPIRSTNNAIKAATTIYNSNQFLLKSKQYSFCSRKYLKQKNYEDDSQNSYKNKVVKENNSEKNDLQTQEHYQSIKEKNDDQEYNINHGYDNVCVISPSFFHDSKEDKNSNEGEYETIALDIGSKLNIPVLTSTNDSTTISYVQNRQYTHCLRIIPYNILDIGINTYAVAIQPLVVTPKEEERKKTKRKIKTKNNKFINTQIKPFYVDFCGASTTSASSGLSNQRMKNLNTELLVKAIGISKKTKKEQGHEKDDYNSFLVYDLTAGFGRDSCIIALSNTDNDINVCMVERHPIIALLVQDAIRRNALIASSSSSQSTTMLQQQAVEIQSKINFYHDNAIHFLKTRREKPEVCYLDPMFPSSHKNNKKNAAVKKNMQLLHDLVNVDDHDDNNEWNMNNEELLKMSLEMSKSRVVVKRPINAISLAPEIQEPSFSIRGSVNRFDVYLKK